MLYTAVRYMIGIPQNLSASDKNANIAESKVLGRNGEVDVATADGAQVDKQSSGMKLGCSTVVGSAEYRAHLPWSRAAP